jgi:hypothetical protein
MFITLCAFNLPNFEGKFMFDDKFSDLKYYFFIQVIDFEFHSNIFLTINNTFIGYLFHIPHFIVFLERPL